MNSTAATDSVKFLSKFDSESSSQSSESAAHKAPTDIAPTPDYLPCQPTFYSSFSATLIGGKQHSFNLEWYKSYSLLEYSVQRNAAFCYPWHLFAIMNEDHVTLSLW